VVEVHDRFPPRVSALSLQSFTAVPLIVTISIVPPCPTVS
jgi:hypothetical protein